MSYTVRRAVEKLKEVMENLPECDHDFSGISEAIVLLSDKEILLVEWQAEDVINCAEDNDVELTKEQAVEVLEVMEKRHDCNEGINWHFIMACIEEVI